jgi:phage gp36-like protein
VPNYFVPADLVAATSQRVVDQYFDDDGDGVADTALVTSMCTMASSAIDAKLLRAFSKDQIVLFAAEPLFKMWGAFMAMHLAAKRRPEWRNASDEAPYRSDWDQAMKYFDDLSKGNVRAQAEATAGQHPILGGHQIANPPTLPTFVFAPDPNRGNPGGSGGY